MRIENLKEGMVIKNYKELCKLLEVDVLEGNSKKKQMEDFGHYCDYTKQGHKIIINEIYETPTISINEMRKGKYIQTLSNIIIEYLYNGDTLNEIPLFKLLNVLGVTNQNYESVNKYRLEFSQLANVQLASIYYFYSNTKMEFKRIVESCLNNLQRRRILNWRRCVIVLKDGKRYKADIKTEKMLLKAEYESLREVHKVNMYELFKDRDAVDEFNRIIQQKTGGLNYYYSYELVIGDYALKCEYDNIQEERKKLNNMMVTKLDGKFSNSKFIKYKNDYDRIIEALINSEYTTELLEDLKTQRIINEKACKSSKETIEKSSDKFINGDNVVRKIRF